MTRERPWMTRLKRDAKFKSLKRVVTRNLAPLSFTTLNPRSPNYTRERQARSRGIRSLSATSSQISLVTRPPTRRKDAACAASDSASVWRRVSVRGTDGKYSWKQLEECIAKTKKPPASFFRITEHLTGGNKTPTHLRAAPTVSDDINAARHHHRRHPPHQAYYRLALRDQPLRVLFKGVRVVCAGTGVVVKCTGACASACAPALVDCAQDRGSGSSRRHQNQQ
ncbi:hypothetical protein CVT25_000726 [Psilocybe cyanescens]|uniref:Uncharacterized protein n=1 Tax=Psilocybe cyanescens TaxID=93625 RepID=A0A409X3K6_PSICY|nr:hypothetical protein CVT25_000726 [Psilocybe cyanescens]